MLDTRDAADHSATATRLRYITEGLSMRISDMTDALGGYVCNVVEVEGRMIWIDLPLRRDGMLDLTPGQLVSVRFDRAEDAVYTFDSVVADVRDDDHAPFGLAMPVTVNRRAHRTDLRIAMVLDASYDVDLDEGPQSLPGKVVDLSAGGLGLICAEQLPEGAEVVVHCEVPGPRGPLLIDQPVEVCSSQLYGRTPGGTTLHQYGMRFTEATDALREEILTSVIWNLTQNPTAL